MLNLNECFTRANLQYLIEFMYHGVEKRELETGSYDTRLENSCKSIDNRLKSLCPDNDEYDKAYHELVTALTAYQHVYTELGMHRRNYLPSSRPFQ